MEGQRRRRCPAKRLPPRRAKQPWLCDARVSIVSRFGRQRSGGDHGEESEEVEEEGSPRAQEKARRSKEEHREEEEQREEKRGSQEVQRPQVRSEALLRNLRWGNGRDGRRQLRRRASHGRHGRLRRWRRPGRPFHVGPLIAGVHPGIHRFSLKISRTRVSKCCALIAQRQAAALRFVAKRASTKATVSSTTTLRMPFCAATVCT